MKDKTKKKVSALQKMMEVNYVTKSSLKNETLALNSRIGKAIEGQKDF
jgi:hypothetical protein